MLLEKNLNLQYNSDYKNTIATYSIIDLKSILMHSNSAKRIVYCPDTQLWLINDAFNSYHPYMIIEAQDMNLTNMQIDDTFGRFYYIPTKFKNTIETFLLVYSDYTEIKLLKIFDTFILGCADFENNPGADIFFNLFIEPKIDIISIEDLPNIV